MKREFLINISFLILINVLIKPFYILFIEARVQDTVGPNSFGLYFGIFNVAFILQILADLGIQNYNSRTIATNPTLLKEYLPKILATKLVLSLIYLLAGLGVAALFGYLADSGLIFLMISVNLILVSLILYLRTNIAATGHYRLDSFISVLDKLFLIFILSYLLFYPGVSDSFDLFSFIYAQTAAFVLVLIITLILNIRIAGVFKLEFDLEFSKDLIKKSFPFSLVIILMSLYMRMDGFMLENLLDDQAFQAGVYAASFRVYEAFNMIGYLFAVLLLPMFASLLKKREELLALIKSSHNLILAISTTIVTGSVLYAEEIMLWLYPKNADLYYGEVLTLLLFSFFAISISYIYGTYLTAASKLKQLNRLLLGGVIINLVLNLVMIPKFGAKGAAISTIFTQFFVLAGQYLLTSKELSITTHLKTLLMRLSYVAIILITGILYYKFMPISSWIIAFILLMVLFALIAFAFGLLNLKDLRKVKDIN